MKQKAFSSLLLSLICLHPIYSEEFSSTPILSQDLNEEELSQFETDPLELEKELLSLEQELLNKNEEGSQETATQVDQETPSLEQNLIEVLPVSKEAENPFIEIDTSENSALEQDPIFEEVSETESLYQEAPSLLPIETQETPVLNQSPSLDSIPALSSEAPSISEVLAPALVEDKSASDPIGSPQKEHILSESIEQISSPSEAAVEQVLFEADPIVERQLEEPLITDAYSEEISDPEAQVETLLPQNTVVINLRQVFSGSPYIYSFLFLMSFASLTIWLYSVMTVRALSRTSEGFYRSLRDKLMSNHFDEALTLCEHNQSFLSKIISSGLVYRKYGLPTILENMKAEGTRSSVSSWQRINFLHDIAILAPMLGLLGTVLGMFYAFYDLNRSMESISNLFDGLGISVGTTVAGIMVAILALVLHSTAKFKLIKSLARVENDAVSLAHLMDEKK